MVKKISIATLLVILIGFNFSIFQKEQIKNSADEVILKLRPVDPRSIIQGDYMTLAYEVEEQSNKVNKDVKKPGFLIIEKGENNIANFVDFYKDQPLTKNQKLIKYYSNWQGARVHPHSFMFQEGKAKDFQQAKYALFKYNGDSDYLLDSLLNEKLEKIN
tara:strand:- start:710 stop:1189 length:480 start_codon:yes stop_codon:yes gene_type:complete